MTEDKIYRMLGLAMKAGKLECGEGRCEEAIKSGRANLVVVSKDASENTLKKFQDMAKFRSIPMLNISNRRELGFYVGRGEVVSIAVCSNNFAAEIIDIYNTKHDDLFSTM